MHERMNLQIPEYFSMVLLRAAWASEVRASASSMKMILNSAPPTGDVLANSLILPRTTSIPLSSEAFSSMKFPCQLSPNISLVRARAQVVFPVPAGPVNSRWGMLLDLTYAFSLSVTWLWPATSSRVLGRYFSVQISFMGNVCQCARRLICCLGPPGRRSGPAASHAPVPSRVGASSNPAGRTGAPVAEMVRVN